MWLCYVTSVILDDLQACLCLLNLLILSRFEWKYRLNCEAMWLYTFRRTDNRLDATGGGRCKGHADTDSWVFSDWGDKLWEDDHGLK